MILEPEKTSPRKTKESIFGWKMTSMNDEDGGFPIEHEGGFFMFVNSLVSFRRGVLTKNKHTV